MRRALMVGGLLLWASVAAAQIQVVDHPQITSYATEADWPSIDQQNWWRGTPTEEITHVHVGCKLPYKGVISGPVEFGCTLMLFKFDGVIDHMDRRGDPGNPFLLVEASSEGQTVSDPTGMNWTDIPLAWRTGDPTGLKVLDVRLVMAPSNFKDGGATEIMLKSWSEFTDHNGLLRAQAATMRVPVWVTGNGEPENPIGPGWKLSVNAYMTGQPPTSGREPFDYSIVKDITEIPLLPLSSPWTISAHWNPYPKALISPAPFEASYRYDPNFHVGNEGTVVLSTFSDVGRTETWTIDPATLTDGPHKIMLRNQIEDPATGELQASATVIEFEVDTGAPPQFTLTLTTTGTGSGTVSPAGVYDEGTLVTLVATPDAGSTFDGWSGAADCTDGSVTMTVDITCTATFTDLPTLYDVTVDQTVTCNDCDQTSTKAALDAAIDAEAADAHAVKVQ